MANQLKHIAIIMDGNGRWARKRGFERFLGHRKGTESTIDAVEVGVNLKLEHMTLYVFSSENWGRPTKEVDYLMNLLIEMVYKEIIFGLNRRETSKGQLKSSNKEIKLETDRLVLEVFIKQDKKGDKRKANLT